MTKGRSEYQKAWDRAAKQFEVSMMLFHERMDRELNMTNKMTTDKAVEMIDERIGKLSASIQQIGARQVFCNMMSAITTQCKIRPLRDKLDQWKQLREFVKCKGLTTYQITNLMGLNADNILLKKENAELKEMLAGLAKFEITPKTHDPLWYDIRGVVNGELIKNAGCISISADQKNDTLTIIADKIMELIKNEKR